MQICHRPSCLYLCYCILFPALLGAESTSLNEPLVSDRPDFTESTATIPATHLQFESGYTFVQDSFDGGTSRSYTFPEILLRIGLSDYIEARLGWEGALIDHPAAEGGSHGSSDTSVGAKVGLGKVDIINISTIIDMELPTGSRNRTADRVQPGTKLLWSTDITDLVAVAGNINYASRVSGDDRFNEWGTSLSFGVTLATRVAGYLEYFEIYPDSTPIANAESYLTGGVTYLLSNDLQLDARVGAGFNEDAADFFSGFGLAWRH